MGKCLFGNVNVDADMAEWAADTHRSHLLRAVGLHAYIVRGKKVGRPMSESGAPDSLAPHPPCRCLPHRMA